MSSSQESLSSRPPRLALAAVLHLFVSVVIASAQTVILRDAPAGSTVEVVVNATKAGSATADEGGDATIRIDLPALVGKTETDASVHVEVCGAVRRVLIVERGMQAPPPDAGCERRDVPGLFFIRRITTLVVNTAGVNPSLLLVQGSFDPRDAAAARPTRLSPTGVVVLAGAGLTTVRDAADLACGDVQGCEGDSLGAAYTVGADVWLLPFLAAEATYMKPGNVTADGTGTNFRFNSFLDASLLTVAGKLGAPIGPLRLYGRAGANYHRATFGTTQINEDITVTVDGVTRVIPGGTQNFELKTAGWGWLFGGGFEVWIRPSVAFFADGAFAGLKGSARNGGDGALDDRVISVLIGGKLRIGG